MRGQLGGGLLLALWISGCDADCSNPERVNQAYEVWHSVVNTPDDSGGASGQSALEMTADYPSYELFVNGCSRWEFTYQSAAEKVNVNILDIDEVQGTGDADSATQQKYEGSLTADAENCNVFTVKFAGQYQAPTLSNHDFEYTATLAFFGDAYSGTFTYSDIFTGLDADGAPVEGSIVGASGEVFGEVPGAGIFAGGSDTASPTCYGAVALAD